MTEVDVAVVGAGPAGMAAATALAQAGLNVLVVDEQAAPGGQVFRAAGRLAERSAQDRDALGTHYAKGPGQVEAFRHSGAEFFPRTSVWQLELTGSGPLLWIRRNGEVASVGARHVVVATGAMERPTPFPGWTLPGVLHVGAAQTLFKESALLPGGRVAIAGSGPLLYLFAAQMLRAGKPPAMILETTPPFSPRALRLLPAALPSGAGDLLRGLAWLKQLRRAGVRRIGAVNGLRARGDSRLQGISWSVGRSRFDEAVDLLLVHDGVVPNSWLAMSAGCGHRWSGAQTCWAPTLESDGSVADAAVSIAGDAAGIVGADGAALQGRIVGLKVAKRLGANREYSELRALENRLRSLAGFRRLLDKLYPASGCFSHPQATETVVCRCENVTVAQIQAAAALGCTGPNQTKAYTRCGMGACQGRECGIVVSQLIAKLRDLPLEEVGHYRVRPPIRPLTVGELAGE